MLIDHNCCVFGNVTGDFLSSFLVDEATKTSDVDVFSFCHRVFYNLEECLNCLCYIILLDSCFVRNLSDYFCFCHFEIILEIMK